VLTAALGSLKLTCYIAWYVAVEHSVPVLDRLHRRTLFVPTSSTLRHVVLDELALQRVSLGVNDGARTRIEFA
jgi:hypothetical protein